MSDQSPPEKPEEHAKSTADNALSVRLVGQPENHHLVYVGDFVRFLQDLSTSLRRVDQAISDGQVTADYRIRGLASGTAAATIEAVPLPNMPDHGPRIVHTWTEALKAIEYEGKRPPEFGDDTLEAFAKLGAPLQKRVQRIEARYEEETVVITAQLQANIEKILGEDTETQGTVVGQLDAINVHSQYAFYIYPVVGAVRVQCLFPSTMLEDVAKAIKRYVTVSGTLHFRAHEPFPRRVEVQELEVHPPEEELPSLGSLRGMAPDMTGELSAAEFVRKLRDEEEDY